MKALVSLLAVMVLDIGCSDRTESDAGAPDIEVVDQLLPPPPRDQQVDPPDAPPVDLERPGGWAVALGGVGLDAATAVSLDNTGAAYVAGLFSGDASLGQLKLTSVGGEDAFLARVLPDGSPDWAKTWGSSSHDRLTAVQVGPTGDVYVAGWHLRDIQIGAHTCTSDGNLKGFVARLSGSGLPKWAVCIDAPSSTDSIQVNDLAVDSAGNGYVVGVFYGAAVFGAKKLVSPWRSAFVAKITAAGGVDWAKCSTATTTSDARAYGVDVDSTGHAYMVGEFGQATSFGPVTVTPSGASDGFIAKVSPVGDTVWAVGIGGQDSDWIEDVATRDNGESFVVGSLSGPAAVGSSVVGTKGQKNVLVARVSASGDWTWATASTSGHVHPGAITIGPSDVFVTGMFSQTMRWAHLGWTSNGKLDAYFVHLDPSGVILRGVAAGGPGDEWPHGIALVGGSTAVLVGDFEAAATFNSTKLTAAGYLDALVWRAVLP